MLDGVNDTPEDARRLVRLLSGIKAKVNLIPLNPAPGIPYERPSDERVDRFAQILADRHITVSVRKSRGRDIRAACGQLIVEGGHEEDGRAADGAADAIGRSGCVTARDASAIVARRCGPPPTVPRSLLDRAAPSGSSPSPPTSHRPPSAPRRQCRPATAGTVAVISLADRANLPAARPDRQRRRPCRQRARLGARPIGVRETRAGASAAVASEHARISSKCASVSPGKPTMTSEPIDACGMRARMRSTSARSTPPCRAGASRAASSSEPCCSGRWKCGARRGDAATSSTISGVQSIGSSELMRNSTSSVHSRERADERGERRCRPEVAPVRPEVHAGERDLLVAGGDRALDRRASTPVERLRAAGAARLRDDAVAAALVASGLHAQRQCRAAATPGTSVAPHAAPSPSPNRSAVVSQARSRRATVDEASLSEFGTTRATFGQRRDFVGTPRRIAAGHDHLHVRIVARRCAGSSAARPGRRSRSPSRC